MKPSQYDPIERLQFYTDAFRDAALDARTLNSALSAAHVYGWLQYLNRSGVYSGEEVEEALYQKFAAQLGLGSLAPAPPLIDWLHILSEAPDFGGHTRLVENILNIHSGQGERSEVIVTRWSSSLFRKRCGAMSVPLTLLRGTPAQTCAQLIRLGLRTRFLVLSIHPDDISAALAARILRSMGILVFFINHADDRFSFGVGAANVVLEVSAFGWQITNAYRPAMAHHFLGIPVRHKNMPRHPQSNVNGPILSIGSPHKYEPSSAVSFQKFIDSILSQTLAHFELIGPTGHEKYWREVVRKYPGRIVFCGIVPHGELAVRLSKASCYVDSFPMTGGTTFTEAFVSGLPVFGAKEAPVGYSPADVLRYGTVEKMSVELVRFLKEGHLTPNYMKRWESAAREIRQSDISVRLANLIVGNLSEPPESLMKSISAIDLEYFVKQWRESGKIVINFPAFALRHVPMKLKFLFLRLIIVSPPPFALIRAAVRNGVSRSLRRSKSR